MSSLVGSTLSPSQWALASCHVRLGGLDSVAAASFSLLQMDVRHGRLVALATLDPACMSMTSALRSRLTVGLPLRQDIKEDELYDKWIDQHAWSSFQAELSANILTESVRRANGNYGSCSREPTPGSGWQSRCQVSSSMPRPRSSHKPQTITNPLEHARTVG